MRNIEHVVNVADWMTKPQDLIEKINQFLGDHSSGCFVVTLYGPMAGDDPFIMPNTHLVGVDNQCP